MIEIIDEAGGFVYMVKSDDHNVNQNAFKLFHQNYDSFGIECTKLNELYLMYDPVHLLKSINWITQKVQTLTFFDFETNSYICPKWKDIIDIYKEDLEKDVLLKDNKLNRQSLWHNNFEKQKVHLLLNMFDDKVVARLEQKGCMGMSIFFKCVLRCGNFEHSLSFSRKVIEQRRPGAI